MPPFTSPFGGSTIEAAQVAYRAVALTGNVALVWPPQSQSATDFVARLMDVTPTGGPWTMQVSDARLQSNGFDIFFTNLGSTNYSVMDNLNNTLLTIAPGTVWYLFLKDNSTQQGTWGSFQIGAQASSQNAAALAGAGLVAIGSTLNANYLVVSTSASYAFTGAERANVYVWTGGGGTFTLKDSSIVGNGWFVGIKNAGTGTLTLASANAGDTFDGGTAGTPLLLNPNESLTIYTNGLGQWYSVGRGRNTVFAFTELIKTAPGGTYTLLPTEYVNVVQKYIGTPASNTTIVLPAIVQVYYIQNAIGGANNGLSFKTAGVGSTVSVPVNQNAILFCDGTNVINASTTVAGLSSLVLNPGSVIAPAISWTGDPQTGIYQAVTGETSFASSGVKSGGFSGVGVSARALIPTASTVPTNGLYLPGANTIGLSAGGVAGFVMSAASCVITATGSTSTTQLQQTLGASPASLDTGGIIDLRNLSITGGDTRVLGFGQIGGSAYIRANLSAAGTNAPLDIYTAGALAARFATTGNLLVGGTTDLGAGYAGQIKTATTNQALWVDIRNSGTTGVLQSSGVSLVTSTANSLVQLYCADNNGSPFGVLFGGSALSQLSYRSLSHTFANSTGSTTFATIQASGTQISATSGGALATIGTPANNSAFQVNATDGSGVAVFMGVSSGYTSSSINTFTSIPLSLGTANTARISIASAGNVTVNAPASGNTLTATAFAGAATAAVFLGGNNASSTGLLVQGGFTGAGTISLVSFQDLNNVSGVNLRLVGNGATTPSKTFRVINGAFQIVNDAYTQPIFQLADDGTTKLGHSATPANIFLNSTGVALATGATVGFAHLPSMAGLATGTPTGLLTGAVPVAINSNLGLLMNYLTVSTGSAWCSAAPTAPVNPQSGNYTLLLSDAGGGIDCTNAGAQTITIPANSATAFPIGTLINIVVSGTTNVSLAITTDTLTWAGNGGTGTRTLSATLKAAVTLYKRTATNWYVSGSGIS
jgi:hypothetical protein